MSNISQYANYAISNATGQPTDCIPSGNCQEFTCTVGNRNSSITFTTLPCEVPPAMKTVVKDPSGEVTASGKYTNTNNYIWNIGSHNLNLAVTLQHPNASAVILQASCRSLPLDCNRS